MNVMKQLLSIIVPVYNVESYLQQCIESILSQSYRDIDLILVDDGSKDSSGAICDAYAEKDRRVHVQIQETQGCGMQPVNMLRLWTATIFWRRTPTKPIWKICRKQVRKFPYADFTATIIRKRFSPRGRMPFMPF